MKKLIASIILASLLATPAVAGKFDLSQYKTVAVQPVLGASNTRGQFESTLAAQASTWSYAADKAGAIDKASSKGLDSQGFGFAGKAQGGDVALMVLSTTLGMMPTMLQLDANKAKASATQLQQYVAAIDGKVDADVTKALNIALTAINGNDFQTAMKALLVAMAVSADSIKKGSERQHGYIAVGLYAGLATIYGAAGQGNTALAELATPLIALLEQDAVMGGADRTVAAQLKIVQAELNGSAPNLDKIVAAIGAMQSIKPD